MNSSPSAGTPPEARLFGSEERAAILGFGPRRSRKTAYPALRSRVQQVARSRDLLDSADDGIFLLRLPRVEIVEANERGAALFDHQADELAGRELAAFLGEPAVEQLRQSFANATGAVTVRRILLKVSPTGHRRVVDCTLKPSHLDDDELCVAIFRDAAEQVAYEQALSQERERADRAEQSRQAFLTMISHELLTPLNPISALLEVMRADERNRFQAEELEMMQESANKLESLLQSMLTYIRLDAGDLRLEPVTFRTCDCCQALRRTYTAPARKTGLSFANGCADCQWGHCAGFSTVRGDRGKIERILAIFVENAIKFSDAGSISATSRCVSLEGRIGHFRFEVRDKGPGIDPAVRAQLFQPFRQADESLARRYEGVGLNLAIARKYAALMGGEVGVESEVGRGSVFWMTLPLEIVEPAASLANRHTGAARG